MKRYLSWPELLWLGIAASVDSAVRVCLQRLTAKFVVVKGRPTALRQQAIEDQIDTLREPHLLALVYDELRKQGWLQITTDVQNVLAALNLVECVATAAPRNQDTRGD